MVMNLCLPMTMMMTQIRKCFNNMLTEAWKRPVVGKLLTETWKRPAGLSSVGQNPETPKRPAGLFSVGRVW